jgi:hypothetical protein
MSPEQVRGEKLDARTDLFSFGLVIYEMTVGQRAFTGETAPILHDAILNHTPTPVRDLNQQIPTRLEAIIDKALEKDREARYQSAQEMRADLKSLAASLPRESDAVTTKRAPRSAGRVLSAAVLALLLVAIIAWLAKPQPSTLPHLIQKQLTANSSENPVSSGTISPDGRYLAYADLRGLHTKLLETGEIRTIPQPDDFKGIHVNWNIIAPWVDGTRFIAAALIRGQQPSIWLVPVTGEAPRKFRDNADPWSVSRDGAWVAFGANLGRVGYRELWMMKSGGEQAHKFDELDENGGFGGAEWSPDGQRLSYGKWGQVGKTFVHNIESRDLKGGPAVTAMPDLSRHWDWWWSPDG